MGRKAIKKDRQQPNDKTRKWALDLLPKLKSVRIGPLTMDELAQLMNKSKSTVYQYFQSKEALIEYLVEVRLEAMQSVLKLMAAPPPDPRAAYEAFLRELIIYTHDLSPYFIGDLKNYYPTAWSKVRTFVEGLLDTMRIFYENGIKAGYFRPVSTALLLAMDEFFVFQYLTMANNNYTTPQSLESQIQDYLYLRFEGILQ